MINDIKNRISYLKKDIEQNKKLIHKYEKQLICKHDLNIVGGDNISTTGPTGLYQFCNKCGYNEEVGYIGEKGNVFYKDLEKKKKKISNKLKQVGLTVKGIKELF
jgi:hypothetical protein